MLNEGGVEVWDDEDDVRMREEWSREKISNSRYTPMPLSHPMSWCYTGEKDKKSLRGHH